MALPKGRSRKWEWLSLRGGEWSPVGVGNLKKPQPCSQFPLGAAHHQVCCVWEVTALGSECQEEGPLGHLGG